MGSSQAHRLMDAVEVVHNISISPIGEITTLPKTENVVRPLVGLDPDEQAAV